MTDILMPRLTDQMEAGTIIAWLVEDGETVDVGQEIVEIETDKATIAHPADAAGVLETVAGVGDSVAVGEVIARVGVAPERIASGSRAGGGLSSSAAAGDDEPSPAPSSVPAAAPVASNGKAGERSSPPWPGGWRELMESTRRDWRAPVRAAASRRPM